MKRFGSRSLLSGFLVLLLSLCFCLSGNALAFESRPFPSAAVSLDLPSGGKTGWEEKEAEHRPGDVNEDGYVDGRDIVRLMKWLAGEDVYINEQNADTTLDNTVDERDLLRMIALMGGLNVLDFF